MATEYLKINITADNKNAIAGINQTVASLDKIDSAAKKSGDGIAKAKVNYQDLGRVLQDLPYGFNAIANNLTQLVPAAGAVGLAFTALVTALTFAQQGFGAWTRGMGKSKEELDALNEYTKDFSDNLAKEKVQLDTLYTTATNANIPLEQRKNAIKELRDNYGNYLKNFSDEQILAGQAANAYNALSEAILRSAKARAAQDQMVELQKKAIQKEIELQNIATKAQEDASKAKAASFDIGMGKSISMTAEQAKTGIFAQASKEAKTVANEIGEINKELKKYADLVQQNQVDPFKPIKQSAPKAVKSAKETVEKFSSFDLRNKSARLDINKQQGTILNKPEVTDTTKIKLQENQQLNQVLAQQYEIQQRNNEAVAQATILTDASMQVFNSLTNAILTGQNIGEALGDTFKKLALDIAAAAAKAFIFQTILSLLPTGGLGAGGGFGKALGGLLGFANGGTVTGPKSGYPVMLHGTESIVRPDQMSKIIAGSAKMGQSMSEVQQGPAGGQFVIRGNDLVLAQQRANYSLNLRRG